MLETLDLPFVQRGLAEVALLSVGAGLIGTWIVLRGLAFYSHAVGTAAFPGLVLADGLGFAAPVGALGAAAVFAVLLAVVSGRRGAGDRGSEIALILAGMMALGVILASDVFESSSSIETLLFGSLLLVDGPDLILAAGVSALAVLAAALAGRHWVARGFDAGSDGADAGGPAKLLDLALLPLIAMATAAALTAVGALLVAALFVVPAATTRLFTTRLRPWQLASVALCAVEGAAGVLLSVELNAPPGATIAVVAGGVFALAALASWARRRGGSAGRVRRAAVATGAAAVTLLLISGCGDGAPGAPVVATTPIAGDLAAEVAGGDIEVATLLRPNTDPHEYEPRPHDIEALAAARLVVASGGEVDGWIGEAMDDAGSDAELLVLAVGIPHPVTGAGDEPDPHWWQDPRNAADAVERIGGAMAEVDPERAASIERRAGAFAREIGDSDTQIAACLEAIPAPERKLVTDHDAFAYLGERYDLEIVGAVIPALTTEAQPSAGELADLRETIDREGVRAVFPETSLNDDLARAIARETGASADYELYGDTLGPEGSAGEGYLGMIRANADSLARGLTAGRMGCP